MKRTFNTTLIALVLFGIGGFIVGRISTTDSSPAVKSAVPDKRPTRSESRSFSEPESSSGRNLRAVGKSGSRDPVTPEQRLARLESIVRSEDLLGRSRALLAFIDQLAPRDFEGAVAHFRSLGITEDRLGEYSLLLTSWAQTDPAAALAYTTENTNGKFASDAVLTAWASRDPEAAIRWANTHHQGDGANPYLPGIIRSLSQSDPARATQLLAAMPKSTQRAEALDFFMPHLLQKGKAATHAWIASLSDESLKNGAMTRAAGPLAKTDPQGTISWLLANPSDAAVQRLDNIFSDLMKSNPSAAASTFASIPAGPYRSTALRGMVNSVSKDDPNEGVKLMNLYPNDTTDRVVQNFIWHSFGTDPITAISQIPRIANEQDREKMYQRTLRAWMNQDPIAAEGWIQRNPLTQTVRDYLARPQPQ